MNEMPPTVNDVDERLNINNLMAGTLATLAVRGVKHINLPGCRYDEAMAEATRRIRATGRELDFRIVPDRLHGNSPTAREALLFAAMCDLVRLQDSCAYLHFGADHGRLMLDLDLADLDAYDQVVACLAEADLLWPPIYVAS